MSVLIKEMEMPKSCKSCDLLQDYDGDMYCPLNNYLNFGDIENVPDYVMSGCPLSAQPEVIRCKDCKHWMPYDWMFSEVWQSQNMDDYPEKEIGCQYCDMSMGANDFCSRAERREDEGSD